MKTLTQEDKNTIDGLIWCLNPDETGVLEVSKKINIDTIYDILSPDNLELSKILDTLTDENKYVILSHITA